MNTTRTNLRTTLRNLFGAKSSFRSRRFAASVHASILALSLGLLSACSADEVAPGTLQGASLSVRLQLPQSRSLGVTVSEGSSQYDPQADECAINSLHILGFPYGGSGDLVNTAMIIPASVGTDPSPLVKVGAFSTIGKYRVFIVANCGSLDFSSVTTEEQLRALIMDYTSSLPQGANLPMVYEPTGSGHNVEISESLPHPVLNASLSIAAVKVKLNVIFDKSEPLTQAAFGDLGLRISDVTVRNVSARQRLIPAGDVMDDARTATLSGAHYSSYTITPANASLNNRDVVENLSGAHSPSDPAAKWAWSGVIYLPERLVTDNDRQAVIDIDGQLFSAGGAAGSADAVNHYSIELGHDDGGLRQLPRNTYYEIVARIKSFGDMEVSTFMSVDPWSVSASDINAQQYRLSVSATEVPVSSLEPYVLSYSTDAPSVTFSCPGTITQGGVAKPIILAEQDAAAGTFTFKVNPAIEIESLSASQTTGSTTVCIAAANIRKYITVNYDIKPFFTVTPTEFEIFWDGSILTKDATVVTNFKDVRVQSHTFPFTLSKSGTDAQVNVSKTVDTSANGTWLISNALPRNPGSTTTFTYVIGPASDTHFDTFKKTITVTVKPPFGHYRIYMRAINDAGHADEWDASHLKTEYTGVGSTNNNWYDGWGENGQSTSMSSRHKVYIYYQYGETVGGVIPTERVWMFTSGFPGELLSGDANHPGWYLFTIDNNKEVANSSGVKKKIVPGETLLIFSDCNSDSDYKTRHRFPHHLDAGMTLFDFEDREGWYVYDPLSVPYYSYYDEKPEIIDQVYTVYYPGTISGWYINYGNGDGAHSLYKNGFSYVGTVGSYKKYQFTFKAVKGSTGKGIKLKTSAHGDQVMFNYANWTEGYFDGSSWHKGQP